MAGGGAKGFLICGPSPYLSLQLCATISMQTRGSFHLPYLNGAGLELFFLTRVQTCSSKVLIEGVGVLVSRDNKPEKGHEEDGAGWVPPQNPPYALLSLQPLIQSVTLRILSLSSSCLQFYIKTYSCFPFYLSPFQCSF